MGYDRQKVIGLRGVFLIEGQKERLTNGRDQLSSPSYMDVPSDCTSQFLSYQSLAKYISLHEQSM